MIVDFHTHTFPEKIAATALTSLSAASRSRAFTKGTPDALNDSMKKAGIDLCVVHPVATNPAKVARINDLSAAQSGEKGQILFGCIHPCMDSPVSEVDRVAELGLKGLKIHPVYQGVDIEDTRYLRILSRAGEKGLLVLMHAGDDIGFPGVDRCSPESIARALAQTGGEHVILAHMGGWKRWDRVAETLCDSGAYLDTSFSLGEIPVIDDSRTAEEKRLLRPEEFCALVRAFSSERILFGTDSPWMDQSGCVEAIRRLPLTEEEKENVLGKNAARLLNL